MCVSLCWGRGQGGVVLFECFFLVGWVLWIRLGVQSFIHVVLVFDWIIMGQFDYRHT